MSDLELKEMVEGLMELLNDCHTPASVTKDWALVDRINNNWSMLEDLNNRLTAQKQGVDNT